jgi:uncharacterized membrane protein
VETVTVAATRDSWLLSSGALVVCVILVAAVAVAILHIRSRNNRV